MKFFLLLFLFFMPFSDAFGDNQVFTFQELKQNPDIEVINGKVVSIRGFLYQSKDSEWILASEPNLKTCCVGSRGKADQQIALIGNFEGVPLQRVITVRGSLHVEKNPSVAGKQNFSLTNVEYVSSSSGMWMWIVGFLLIGLAFFMLRKYRSPIVPPSESGYPKNSLQAVGIFLDHQKRSNSYDPLD